MEQKTSTIIESLGVYLPPESISTTEVLEGCKNQIRFPLEKISGIKNRRMAGGKEFSIDLARKAIADCLEKSSYRPSEIDLLICCNISRFDGAESLSFEPATSMKLRNQFGFSRAMVFDITNACAGMFTGIYIVNALLKSGAIRNGLVVSGEYITHLTESAQQEIENFMDNRLACLTLGDAGAAVILDQSGDGQKGFQQFELQTFGRYSPYCIAKESKESRWMMYTDSVNLTDVALKTGAKSALDVLKSANWPPDTFQHLIMHQTSTMTMNSARREINQMLNSRICHDGNTINNLEQRGNTASTSHFVAIADHIENDHIQSGDKVVFSISASGLTVGTALYVFDDLPDRIRQWESKPIPQNGTTASPGLAPLAPVQVSGIRIESVGTVPPVPGERKETLELMVQAANQCLGKSAYACNEIDLLICCGVYRTEYLMEPAMAALLAGRLDMNATISNPEHSKTLAFDIFNGAMGFLNACFVARQMITAGTCRTAMVVAAETENNAAFFPDQLLGVQEAASAIILDASPVPSKGLSAIRFGYQSEFIGAYTVTCSTEGEKPVLQVKQDAALEDLFVEAIVPLVRDFLQQAGLERHQIDRVFPPQISTAFINRLSDALDIPREKFVDAAGEGPDLFSSSLPFGLEVAYAQEGVKPGDTGLIIAVSSGIQAGCALYYF